MPPRREPLGVAAFLLVASRSRTRSWSGYHLEESLLGYLPGGNLSSCICKNEDVFYQSLPILPRLLSSMREREKTEVLRVATRDGGVMQLCPQGKCQNNPTVSRALLQVRALSRLFTPSQAVQLPNRQICPKDMQLTSLAVQQTNMCRRYSGDPARVTRKQRNNRKSREQDQL